MGKKSPKRKEHTARILETSEYIDIKLEVNLQDQNANKLENELSKMLIKPTKVSTRIMKRVEVMAVMFTRKTVELGPSAFQKANVVQMVGFEP